MSRFGPSPSRAVFERAVELAVRARVHRYFARRHRAAGVIDKAMQEERQARWREREVRALAVYSELSNLDPVRA